MKGSKNGSGQVIDLSKLSPEVQAALANGRAVDLTKHVPPEIQVIREVNSFKKQVDEHEKEAAGLLAVAKVHPAADPVLVQGLEAYHSRLQAVQAGLAPLHLKALMGVAPKVADEIELVLERVRKLVLSGEPAATPTTNTEGK